MGIQNNIHRDHDHIYNIWIKEYINPSKASLYIVFLSDFSVGFIPVILLYTAVLNIDSVMPKGSALGELKRRF